MSVQTPTAQNIVPNPVAHQTQPIDTATAVQTQPQAIPPQPQPQPGIAPHTATNVIASTDVVNMIEKARQDEKAKVYSTIEKLKTDAKAKEAELVDMKKKVDELSVLANKDLPADQKVKLQIDAMRQELEKERVAREESERNANERIRLTELEAYRHRRLAEVGVNTLIPELVLGTTPEEIEASIMVSRAEYQRLRDQFHAEFAAAQPQPPSVVSTTPGVPSPHFTPPAMGYPSVVSPVPVSEQRLDLNSVASMTSEEAVRSGNYEQVRGQLLDRIRSLSPAGGSRVLGSTPRHVVPSPVHSNAHYQMPGNVMQPMGSPVGPTTPPGMYQTPQQAPTASQDPRVAAMAALDRTNAGGNPLLASQMGKAPPGPMPQGGASNAQMAFQARFQPTPPVSPGQGQ